MAQIGQPDPVETERVRAMVQEDTDAIAELRQRFLEARHHAEGIIGDWRTEAAVRAIVEAMYPRWTL